MRMLTNFEDILYIIDGTYFKIVLFSSLSNLNILINLIYFHFFIFIFILHFFYKNLIKQIIIIRIRKKEITFL